MLLRIIGAVLVCSSSALLGMYLARLDHYRSIDLNEWKKAMLILRSQIAFAAVPLPEAMNITAERVGEPVSATLKLFAQRLLSKDSADVYSIWTNTVKGELKNSYLKQEDFDWLSNFGKTLGFLDTTMQLNSIDLTVSYIDSKTEALAIQSEKHKKMYGSLGILGGLLTVVILL